jgi:hypothetical protein
MQKMKWILPIYLTILFWLLLSRNYKQNMDNKKQNKHMPERVIFYIGDTPIPPIQNISTPYRKNAKKHYMAINQWPLYYGVKCF